MEISRISNGDFPTLSKSQKSLDKLSETQSEFFSNLGTDLEELLDYVQQLEREIEILNIRLVDDTPEHVELVNNFIKKTAEIKISGNLIDYRDDLSDLKEKIKNWENWRNVFLIKEQ